MAAFGTHWRCPLRQYDWLNVRLSVETGKESLKGKFLLHHSWTPHATYKKPDAEKLTDKRVRTTTSRIRKARTFDGCMTIPSVLYGL